MSVTPRAAMLAPATMAGALSMKSHDSGPLASTAAPAIATTAIAPAAGAASGLPKALRAGSRSGRLVSDAVSPAAPSDANAAATR
jgi:hypothetical protein